VDGALPAFDLALSPQLRFILDLGAALALALVGGAIAVRLGQPAVIGYVAAGMAIGPFTPGLTADPAQISALAEVGVVLLLFALGVQFSIRDLIEVRRVAVLGGSLQIATLLVAGTALSLGLGMEPKAALVVGACLSISSTLLLVKVLIERGELDSLHGRNAVGWSILQDIATIVFIVALPTLTGGDLVGPLLLSLGRAAIFLGLAFVAGTRLLPALFAAVARLQSAELFLLAVIGTALITAFASSAIFGLSLALGAFVAGLLVSESDLSYQAAAEVIPFRDLFAVLFFVSVGMLIDPGALVAALPVVILFVIVAVAGKAIVASGLAWVLGLPIRSALLLGGAIAHVGEFSFLLADNAVALDLFDRATYNLVLGTAVLSILVHPLTMRVAGRLVLGYEARVSRSGDEAAMVTLEPPTEGATVGLSLTRSEGQGLPGLPEGRRTIVVLGAGWVGRLVIAALRARDFQVIVVDRDPRRLEKAARLGAVTIYGDAAHPEILRRTGLERAQLLVVALGDPLTTRLAVERARRLSPDLQIAARARGRRQIRELRAVGVPRVADPEAEAAFELARHALQRMGVSGPELNAIVVGLRRQYYGP
jgi:CPA2 family monovalent cation:H+ antiporter-2